jgi:hypothetical protein
MRRGIKQIDGPKSDGSCPPENRVANASSVGIPGIALFSKTAVRRTGVILVVVLRLRIADIARLPVIGLADNMWLDVMLFLLLLALILGERVVQIVLSFRVLGLGLIWVEALSDLFFFAWLVCFSV